MTRHLRYALCAAALWLTALGAGAQGDTKAALEAVDSIVRKYSNYKDVLDPYVAKICAKHKDSPEFMVGVARAYYSFSRPKGQAFYTFHTRDTANARKYVQMAIQLNPTYVPAYICGGDIERTQFNREPALDWYRRAIAANKADPAGYLAYADYASETDPAEALRVLEALRDYNPGYPVYLAAARICDRRGEWEKSLEYFAKAEKDSMTYHDFVTYALNCELMREYQQGLDAALLGLEQYPDSAALNRLAMRQLVILNKYTDALVYVDRLFNKSENAKIGWQDYNYAGRAYFGAKRYGEALSMFTKITDDDELKPVERSSLVDYTARTYANLGDYDKAIAIFSDFVARQERDSALSPGDVYNLANMYMRKAQDSTTVNSTEAWLKADSTFAVMAARFTANADFALANRLQIAYVLDPDFETGRCVPIAEQLVAVVTAKGEADDASTARLLNAYRFLAFHYTINKNRKRSRMYWQKVLELDPGNETAKNVLGIKG